MRFERGTSAKWLMATAASLVAVLGLGVSPAFAHLPVGDTARAMPVILDGSPSIAPYAVCPDGPTSVGPNTSKVVGVRIAGQSGSCAGASAQVNVDTATLNNIAHTQITSITSTCDRASHTATASAVYNGQTISTPTTIVFHEYTFVFNEVSPLGLTAVKIITPRGDRLRLGTAECKK